jgi:hypothetical protein
MFDALALRLVEHGDAGDAGNRLGAATTGRPQLRFVDDARVAVPIQSHHRPIAHVPVALAIPQFGNTVVTTQTNMTQLLIGGRP